MPGTQATPQPRPELAALPEYRAGKAAAAVPGLSPLKLSSNERTHGPSDSVRAQLLESFDFNRYPDPLNTQLRAALSKHIHVPAAQIVTESGSLGALRLLLDALISRGDATGADESTEVAEIIYPWRSFEAYPILVAVAGASGVAVPLRADGSINLNAMADAITPRTQAVFVCTPNNPTGPVVRADDFKAFMRRVPSSVLVVIDEAYVEYVADATAVRGLKAFRAYPNIAVLRTFSKAYGLAGLRIGYAVVSPELAEAMWRIRPTFAVSALAEQAATLALSDQEGLAAHVREVQKGRAQIIAALEAQGEHPVHSEANFVWCEMKDPDDFERRAAAAAISVRRLDQGIRITVGDAAATQRVLALIAAAQSPVQPVQQPVQ